MNDRVKGKGRSEGNGEFVCGRRSRQYLPRGRKMKGGIRGSSRAQTTIRHSFRLSRPKRNGNTETVEFKIHCGRSSLLIINGLKNETTLATKRSREESNKITLHNNSRNYPLIITELSLR